MAPRTVKGKSIEQEEFLAKRYQGRRSRSSGANPHDQGDVLSDQYLFEAKYTEAKSLSIQRRTWEKIHDEAWARGRMPAMAIRFRDPYDKKKNLDLIVLNHDDHLMLLETIQTLEDRLEFN